MVVLMYHTHYTLIQRETPGLIVNTLPNKNLKTNVMDVPSLKFLMANLRGRRLRC